MVELGLCKQFFCSLPHHYSICIMTRTFGHVGAGVGYACCSCGQREGGRGRSEQGVPFSLLPVCLACSPCQLLNGDKTKATLQCALLEAGLSSSATRHALELHLPVTSCPKPATPLPSRKADGATPQCFTLARGAK